MARQMFRFVVTGPGEYQVFGPDPDVEPLGMVRKGRGGWFNYVRLGPGEYRSVSHCPASRSRHEGAVCVAEARKQVAAGRYDRE
jgi:hypothetical protein